MKASASIVGVGLVVLSAGLGSTRAAHAQLVDKTLAPNAANEGINKSLEEQVGAGRGDLYTEYSSAYVMARDPFRAIRRGRQIFQRKFTRVQGQGPVTGDGSGDVHKDLIIGAGLADSCAACHAQPRGSAGAGGDVVTRPDSRNAPHLFGLGLKEMLADEITSELRAIRDDAVKDARRRGRTVKRDLSVRHGIGYGTIIARPNGSVDTSRVEGVDADLRVRPFFLHGETISIREFVVGAFNAEMGLESPDPDLLAASAGGRVVTPTGMVLDGETDRIEAPPVASTGEDADEDGVTNEIPTSIVDFMEFYLLHYFKAGLGEQGHDTKRGRSTMDKIGCTSCHVPDLTIARDRRVADVETVFDRKRGIFNRLFSTASPLLQEVDDGRGHPTLKLPLGGSFKVRNIFTDFKRHDLGPSFHEINYDGTVRKEFLTAALWGVGSTLPYGHDGRSMSLNEVILRHGGEAQKARDRYARLSSSSRNEVLAFLNSLILFPPDDTASNLNPGDPSAPGFPQFGHGSIALTVLFNDPTDVE